MKNVNAWMLCLLLVAAVGGGLLLRADDRGLPGLVFAGLLLLVSIGAGAALRSPR